MALQKFRVAGLGAREADRPTMPVRKIAKSHGIAEVRGVGLHGPMALQKFGVADLGGRVADRPKTQVEKRQKSDGNAEVEDGGSGGWGSQPAENARWKK